MIHFLCNLHLLYQWQTKNNPIKISGNITSEASFVNLNAYLQTLNIIFTLFMMYFFFLKKIRPKSFSYGRVKSRVQNLTHANNFYCSTFQNDELTMLRLSLLYLYSELNQEIMQCRFSNL